jgi:hypothetical protein
MSFRVLENPSISWMRAPHRALVLGHALRGAGPVEADESHIRAAAAWLLQAQRAGGGGGYAHSFHLLHGWRAPYPETSGYIIPTLDRAHRRFNIPEASQSIDAAAKWLQSVQNADGSFCDLSGQAQVFDTGQILIGFNYLAEHSPDSVAQEAMARAARWLCMVQEADGSFVKYAYNRIPHSYYARVGTALAGAGRLLGDERWREAGLRNLRWTLEQQEPNGFFRRLSFDRSPAYLHTMMYVVEGLLDGYDETREQAFLSSAVKFAERALQLARGRDRILRSQYNADWTVANGQKCLTGLAQWAGVCFRLARIEKGSDFRVEGLKTIEYLQRQQLHSADLRLHGSLFGSSPPWGRYMRLALPNWGAKFFIDALLLKAQTNEMVSAS